MLWYISNTKATHSIYNDPALRGGLQARKCAETGGIYKPLAKVSLEGIRRTLERKQHLAIDGQTRKSRSPCSMQGLLYFWGMDTKKDKCKGCTFFTPNINMPGVSTNNVYIGECKHPQVPTRICVSYGTLCKDKLFEARN